MRNNLIPGAMESLPKELQLLLSLTTREQDDRSLSYQRSLAAEINWDAFIRFVRHHRLSALAYKRLQSGAYSFVPPEVVRTLGRDYAANTYRMLHLSGEMDRICRLLEARGIRSLQLKGPALAADLYGDVSLRSSRDLDILVPAGDLNRVNAVLLEHGYVTEDIHLNAINGRRWRQHHSAYYHTGRQVCIEIHWRLGPGPSREPSFEELWERRRVSALSQRPVYYLSEEDLFYYLAVHGARHGWFRLRWLADLDILARRAAEGGRLRTFLRKNQALGVAGQGLLLASKLLKTPLTAELQALARSRTAASLAARVPPLLRAPTDLHGGSANERAYKRYLFATKTKRQKLWHLLDLLYPYPEDAVLLPLPKYIQFIYILLRPILWVWRKARKAALS
ncbi:nucleotidyltransferase family protein [Cohnella lubricantis]|uniref:Nucleotidyltransferase family protein n=1 Tax=Cohnella lubricantis TaxID=2163172 RepID=A0A841T9V7_9BACL|nr:nucleotidyltransferase family protein [Cohnella lubricantis]MBB6676826.1 nucleotidyltransferase family protein [Cohnella lubricantis]MBP2119405.1 hypothetical protein [Cohnella lubricantis]